MNRRDYTSGLKKPLFGFTKDFDGKRIWRVKDPKAQPDNAYVLDWPANIDVVPRNVNLDSGKVAEVMVIRGPESRVILNIDILLRYYEPV